MAKRDVIRLGHLLEAVAGRIELFDREHDVLAINAEEFQLVEDMGEGKGTMAEAIGMITRLVPSFTEAELKRLTPAIIGEIVVVAKGLAKVVDDNLPNSSGATTESPATSESPVT